MALHKNLRGLDLHAPSNELVENNTGSTLTKLKVVRLNGMGTVYPQVELSAPESFSNFGIVAFDIAPGKIGYVTCFGFLFEIDTSAWTVGTELYSDASGNLTTIALGGIVATVIRQDANFGVLYVTSNANSDALLTSWRLDGNNGLNDAVNFLGTVDFHDLRIRTNNLFRAVIDKNGRFGLGPDIVAPANHFHQKSHTGFSGSGLRQETYSLSTNSTANEVAFTVPIDQNSTAKIEFHAVARVSDGSARAAFKRIGLFYRESSNVQIQRSWQTEFTEKSTPGFDVSYSMGVNEVTMFVKSSTVTGTYWTGHVKIEAVKTDI